MLSRRSRHEWVPRFDAAAFYAYAHPAPDGFGGASLENARWDADMGLYLLAWDDARAAADPHGVSVEFARAVFRHACAICEWDEALAASADGQPPAVI